MLTTLIDKLNFFNSMIKSELKIQFEFQKGIEFNYFYFKLTFADKQNFNHVKTAYIKNFDLKTTQKQIIAILKDLDKHLKIKGFKKRIKNL